MPSLYDLFNIPRPRRQSLLSRLKFEKVAPVLIAPEKLVEDKVFTAEELASGDLNTYSVYSQNAAEGTATVEDIAFDNWLKADGLRTVFQVSAKPEGQAEVTPVIWDSVLMRGIHTLLTRPGRQYTIGTSLNARMPTGEGQTLQHLVAVFEDSAKHPGMLELDSVIFYNAQTTRGKREFCPNRSAKKNAEARRLLSALLDNVENLQDDAAAVRGNPEALSASEEFKYRSPREIAAEQEAAAALEKALAEAAPELQAAADEAEAPSHAEAANKPRPAPAPPAPPAP
jgi:hypothetical protein